MLKSPEHLLNEADECAQLCELPADDPGHAARSDERAGPARPFPSRTTQSRDDATTVRFRLMDDHIPAVAELDGQDADAAG